MGRRSNKNPTRIHLIRPKLRSDGYNTLRFTTEFWRQINGNKITHVRPIIDREQKKIYFLFVNRKRFGTVAVGRSVNLTFCNKEVNDAMLIYGLTSNNTDRFEFKLVFRPKSQLSDEVKKVLALYKAVRGAYEPIPLNTFDEGSSVVHKRPHRFLKEGEESLSWGNFY